MKDPKLSEFQKRKIKRENKIYARCNELEYSGLKPVEIDRLIMAEFQIESRSTVWAIRKRVAKRLAS